MTSNRLYIGLSVAFLTAACSVKTAPVAEVVVASYGGAFQDAQAKAFFEPFAKSTGVKVIGTAGTGYAKVKAMVGSHNITWDVVSAESPAFANEVKDGLLEPIDYSVVKADGIPRELRTNYGVGYVRFAQNLAWSKTKFPNGVTPAQFFDPRVKGRRVMPSDPTYSLEFALLADGVKPANLYPLDVDRALKVIDRVKGQIIGYKGSSDIQALIQQGEVDMAYVANGRINDAIKAGADWKYGWDASVSDVEFWAVIKGAPHPAEAMKFINFAVQPEPQAELARQIPYGPTNIDALKLLDAAAVRDLPSNPDNAQRGAIFNSQWWNDNYEAVKARWSTYVMQ